MTRRIVVSLAALLVLGAVPAKAHGPAVGPEFRVNTHTNSYQSIPAIARLEGGEFVVVWQSYFQDNDGFGVFGQRFAADGMPLGFEFQVNTYSTRDQEYPQVAASASGEFVVVWQSDGGQDGDAYGIFGRRFAADGSPAGGEFQVNGFTTGYQAYPAIASDGAGNVLVVWEDFDKGTFSEVFARLFDREGIPAGPEFQVNTHTINNQRHARVASGGDGFVVVWQSDVQDGSNYGLFGQRFGTDGSPLGSEFQVNTYTTGSQAYARVAVDDSGDFVVVWSSSQDGSFRGVFGQRFSADGSPVGSEFQINSYTTSSQQTPAVAIDDAGDLVVTWTSEFQDGDQGGIFAQRFAADGSPRGDEFQVSSHTPGDQYYSAVAASGAGSFVVVWTSDGQDGSATGVFGQRFVTAIFADGFESGDTAAWSGSVP